MISSAAQDLNPTIFASSEIPKVIVNKVQKQTLAILKIITSKIDNNIDTVHSPYFSKKLILITTAIGITTMSLSLLAAAFIAMPILNVAGATTIILVGIGLLMHVMISDHLEQIKKQALAKKSLEENQEIKNKCEFILVNLNTIQEFLTWNSNYYQKRAKSNDWSINEVNQEVHQAFLNAINSHEKVDLGLFLDMLHQYNMNMLWRNQQMTKKINSADSNNWHNEEISNTLLKAYNELFKFQHVIKLK